MVMTISNPLKKLAIAMYDRLTYYSPVSYEMHTNIMVPFHMNIVNQIISLYMDTCHQCTNVNSIDLLNFTRSKQKPNDYCKKII